MQGFICKKDKGLKKYTTFNIGGEAEELFEAYDIKSLKELAANSEKPVLVLGSGSNVLISDNGFKGRVIINKTNAFSFSGGLCICDSGVKIATLSKEYYDNGFLGLEWACSIPGSLGGALKMNAGAFSKEIGEFTEWVEVLRGNETVRINGCDCGFGYRKSGFEKGDIIIRAALKYTLADKHFILSLREKYIEQRRKTQPKGRSAGSVFKGGQMPAGYYIDNAGLKNLIAGGAKVSDLHANFIVNTGKATSIDVLELIKRIKEEVFIKYKVELKEEIEIIGDI